jgi:GTP pyrophosphokinase
MQKTRPQLKITQQYTEDDYLLKLLGKKPAPDSPVKLACDYAWSAQEEESSLPSGLDVALLLSDLGADEVSLVVALLSDTRLVKKDTAVDIAKEFSGNILHMVKSVRWMNQFHLSKDHLSIPEQAERLRRLLLSMVEDVRVVLVKLAYRLQRLRILSRTDTELRRYIATETLEIFAPLANRLGIGQLKWELEDLSLRYLEPLIYKRVAKLLEERREARELYIVNVVAEIKSMLSVSDINAEVYGRPKHIYSIWRKMEAKEKDFSELFDVRAVRITVDTVADCYTALGVVHGKWRHIAKEFDDYIANPKENGYQSLHSAVYGPEGKPLEIQIRTAEMHQRSEFGVAAHWRYKEGSNSDINLEKGINSLKKLLDPDETKDEELIESFHAELFSDRVFILTPNGKVMDLPQGSTPLDFAYAVHTEIGHRCRGAKVNGRIVQLTYELRNGEQVEVLTTNKAAPSRDWMNANLSYLKTKRARSKVRSWFKHQDYDQNAADGRTVFEREVNRLGIHKIDPQKVAQHFDQLNIDNLYASLGRGDLSAGQIATALHDLFAPKNEQAMPLLAKKTSVKKHPSKVGEVKVRGVGNLLTSIANCCKPVPGDEVIGFITRGQGVSVHRQDCVNIINLEDSKRERLIEAEWGAELAKTYRVCIRIEAFDRQGLLRDVTNVFADEEVDVIGINTLSNKNEQTANMSITAEMEDLQQLSKVLDKIAQLQNIIAVSREGGN